ncbi:MAG: tRNA threonylcarbamoyladenosine biosynthesis protein TsaE [uncultured Thermomicrobiales bacterium]|uniref:tRNA threonylcarbamoyladenosine biosynthesis protein TsaE n=1 Tax=uncultured Thermomicrobiales bacterium TaxID=1645740 RepID=A0A6J4UJ41_9BACT|nr:MAG: tRNA threonylcarbamoyladenosine biosynthesis protein TsaE [uncultured Thermomicrobiales bacterium]
MVNRLEVPSGAAMRDLGQCLARTLDHGDVVLLHGDLGAGKTTLVQGLARGLRIAGPIQSPTFGIVSEHKGVGRRGDPLILYHLDLYRLEDVEDLESFGYGAYLDPQDGVSAIEWPERAGSWLPDRFTLVTIQHAGADLRHVTIARHGSGDLPDER